MMGLGFEPGMHLCFLTPPAISVKIPVTDTIGGICGKLGREPEWVGGGYGTSSHHPYQ